jgi:3-(3-hydroxy-phenyl)propionate hydroxylase
LTVAVVGAGPIGLITALGLVHHGLDVVVYEEDGELSQETKAGTVLTRTLEVLRRYDSLDEVLRAAMRIDEVGDLDRQTNERKLSVRTGVLTEDTRLPFLINIPQHHIEPILRARLEELAPGALRLHHRLRSFDQEDGTVRLTFDTPDGERVETADYLLACDGGRSTVREQLGVEVEGVTVPERYMLVDLKVDLDVANARDYPYLAYFGDPTEWMVLVRQPHCWRFLFPLDPGQPEPTQDSLVERACRFIGDVDELEVLGSNIYPVHQRVATTWRDGRVVLLGDAAHLLTPMWALGLNTGVLDASSVPWRIAWIERGWADDALLDGYEREQAAVALKGSGAMAEAARAYMHHRDQSAVQLATGDWGVAITRTLLGVRLDVDGGGDWSMTKDGAEPAPVRAGDRAPDLPLHGPDGIVHVHDLSADSFVALWFGDARARPRVAGAGAPGLRSYLVSRWDAPPDTEQRGRMLLDPGERVRLRFGIEPNTLVLLRPDEHVAAIVPFDPAGDGDEALRLYDQIVREG